MLVKQSSRPSNGAFFIIQFKKEKAMWKNLLEETKTFLLDTFFPRFCLNCQREGNYLCQDCQALLEISEYQYCLCQEPKKLFKLGKCSKCRSRKLSGLYFALPYQNLLIKNLIQKFKYEPFIKELAMPLSSLIISHFQCLENHPNLSDFILTPVPLDKKRLKWRGFNQAEEIGKELSKFLHLPLINDVLIKTIETPPQVELSEKEREENMKEVFICNNGDLIKNKKILLVDDVYTTGATMEECAKFLKEVMAKEVWGVAVARG